MTNWQDPEVDINIRREVINTLFKLIRDKISIKNRELYSLCCDIEHEKYIQSISLNEYMIIDVNYIMNIILEG